MIFLPAIILFDILVTWTYLFIIYGAPITSVPASDYPSIRKEGRDDRTLSFGQQQARNEGGHQCPAGSKACVRAYGTYAIVVGALIRH